MITEDYFYIVPEEVFERYKGYHLDNLYANFLKLFSGQYAINTRVKTDFPDEFAVVEQYIIDNNIPYENRQLDYSEVWYDPEQPPIPQE